MPLPETKKYAQVLPGTIHQLKQWYPRLYCYTQVMQTHTWKTLKFVDMAELQKEFEELK